MGDSIIIDEEKWQQLCNSIDGLTAAFNQLHEEIKPLTCRFQVLSEINEARRKINDAVFLKNIKSRRVK